MIYHSVNFPLHKLITTMSAFSPKVNQKVSYLGVLELLCFFPISLLFCFPINMTYIRALPEAKREEMCVCVCVFTCSW